MSFDPSVKIYTNKINELSFTHDPVIAAVSSFPVCVSVGVTHEIASILDVLPTIASLAGAKLPQVILDGVDMTDMLVNQGKVVALYPPLCRN